MIKKDSRQRLFEVMGRLDKTFKPKLNEEFEAEEKPEVAVDAQEHGSEGASYKAKLEEIVELSQKAYEGLPEGEIPSWVQDKIVIAKEHLGDVYSWMHSEEEEKEGEENPNRKMDDEEPEELQEWNFDKKKGEKKEDKKEDGKKKWNFEKKEGKESLEHEEGESHEEEEKEHEEKKELKEAKPKIPVAAIAKVGK